MRRSCIHHRRLLAGNAHLAGLALIARSVQTSPTTLGQLRTNHARPTLLPEPRAFGGVAAHAAYRSPFRIPTGRPTASAARIQSFLTPRSLVTVGSLVTYWSAAWQLVLAQRMAQLLQL